MYSVADMNNIFLPTNNVTDYQNDFNQYIEQNAPNQTTIINYEQEGSVMSEPMSLSSSPVATDIRTINCVHNRKDSSERRDNDLCSIYEIGILCDMNLCRVLHQHLNCHIVQPFHSTLLHFIVIDPLKTLSHTFQLLYINYTVHLFPLYIQESGKLLIESSIANILW
jgi:hypothetical protein